MLNLPRESLAAPGEGRHDNRDIGSPTIVIAAIDESCESIAAALAPLKAVIDRVRSGSEAVALVSAHDPVLVLLDSRLQDKSIAELCRAVRAAGNTAGIIVVADPADPAAIARLRADADDVVPRPGPSWRLPDRVLALFTSKRLVWVHSALERSLSLLAAAAESAAGYQPGHAERIALMAATLAERIGLPESDLRALRLACLVRDVGNARLPQELLRRKGLLTPEEHGILRSHPVVSQSICGSLCGEVDAALDIIRHHHERQDGSGYPDGLAGDRITLATRVATVADIYCALIAERPYRAAMTHEEALGTLELEVKAGSLDGRTVEVLGDALGSPASKRSVPTILVVDDDRLNRKLFGKLLALAAYRVLEAGDADTAVRLAREECPDLILMDVKLPGADGLTAVRTIRADARLPRVPIVALSAYATRADAERAAEAGCDGYIAKPIDTRRFASMVSKYLPRGD